MMPIVLLAIEWACAALTAGSVLFGLFDNPTWFAAAAISLGIGLWARRLAVSEHHCRSLARRLGVS